MSIERRLEKLTERHEALSQSVQDIAEMQRQNETMLAGILKSIQGLMAIAGAHRGNRHDHQQHEEPGITRGADHSPIIGPLAEQKPRGVLSIHYGAC